MRVLFVWGLLFSLTGRWMRMGFIPDVLVDYFLTAPHRTFFFFFCSLLLVRHL
jgi:hypothetical protein